MRNTVYTVDWGELGHFSHIYIKFYFTKFERNLQYILYLRYLAFVYNNRLNYNLNSVLSQFTSWWGGLGHTVKYHEKMFEMTLDQLGH